MIAANMFAKDSNADIALNVGRLEFSKPFAKSKTAPGATYIDDNTTPFVDAYWLGWIRPENTPTALKMSSRQYDSGADKLTSYDSTLLQNYNVTYFADCFAQNDYAYYNNQGGAIYKYKNTSESIAEKWKAAPEAEQYALRTKRMINHFYIGTVNFSFLRVTYTAINRGSYESAEFDWHWYNTIIDINAEDFETWKTGTQQITIDGQTVTIDNTTLNDNYYTTVIVNGAEYDVAITAYTAVESVSCDSNNTTFNRYRIFPAIDLYATGQESTVPPITTPYEIIFGALGSPYIRFQENDYIPNMDYMKTFDQHNTYYYYNTNRLQGNGGGTNSDCQEIIDRNSGVSDLLSVLPGCFEFEFPDSVATSNHSQTHGVPRGFYFVGNSIMYLLGGNMRYTRMFTPIDIIHHMALMPRWKAKKSDSSSYGVIDGVYYPEVLDSGEFTGRLITGTAEELREKLQPWQYDEITSNDYSGENLPPYVPPEPEDGRWGGDNIRPFDFTNSPINATNNFTTLYALSADTVIDFGQKLWAGLSDPAFWHMVGVEFSNDFSINPADMMHYFLSLRYYPFDLDRYATQTTGIYIGRATTAIEPSVGVTFPYLLNRNVIQIDGGKVFVQLPKHNTNDFRVYDPNTQITAYIPFCGAVQLAASEVYGSTLYLQYTIDLQTGSVTAAISAADDNNHIAVVATLGGSISADIQITANNNIEFLQRIASVVTGTVTQTGSMAMQGAMAGGEVGAAVGAVAGALSGGVASLAGLPPVTVHKQGTSAGFAGYGGVNRAYITIQTGVYDVPVEFPDVHGWRCNVYSAIGDLTGFTVCSNVNTDGLTCTGDEAAEIKRILESGFYA